MKVFFSRNDLNYPVSGANWYQPTASNHAKALKILLDYIAYSNGIDICIDPKKITNDFNSDLKSFCISNDLDFKKPLHLSIMNGHKSTLIVEQSTMSMDDCISFDFMSVCKDIICLNNLKKDFNESDSSMRTIYDELKDKHMIK